MLPKEEQGKKSQGYLLLCQKEVKVLKETFLMIWENHVNL